MLNSKNKLTTNIIIYSELVIFIFIFFYLLFTQHKEIVFYADDFGRGGQQIFTFQQTLDNSLREYMEWTGRFISSFNTYFFLNGRFFLWKIVNPLMIVLLALSLIQISSFGHTSLINKLSITTLVLSFFLTLNQTIAREVLYWATGSFNYLWPLTFAMAFLVLWIKSFSKLHKVKYARYLLIPLSLLAGISNEQVSIVFLLLTLFVMRDRLKKGDKLDKIQIFSVILLFVGTAFVYLAPGNLIRYFSGSDGQALLFQHDILTRIVARTQDIISILISSDMRLLFFYLIFFVALFIIEVPLGIKIYKHDKFPTLRLLLVSSLLSQLIMLVAAYSPYRTFFITSIFILLAISCLVARLKNKLISLAVLVVSLSLFVKSVSDYTNLIDNYRINKLIMEENERTIYEYKKQNQKSEMVLLRLKNDSYGFDMPYLLKGEDDWETPYFLEYYGLEKNQKIKWVY